jgi:hypothetical protein
MHESACYPPNRRLQNPLCGSGGVGVSGRGSAVVSGASRSSVASLASMAGILSTSPAIMRLASACAWRSASNCSLSVDISSLVRSYSRSWVRSGSGVGSRDNSTYNRPPSRTLGKVPRFTLILTAPSLMPSATAASRTGTRRGVAPGSLVWSLPTPRMVYPSKTPRKGVEGNVVALRGG